MGAYNGDEKCASSNDNNNIKTNLSENSSFEYAIKFVKNH